MKVEVLFSPVEFEALPGSDLGDAACVVLDVLRATSTMVTALANGARAILPVATLDEAVAARGRDPTVLLAGERGGLRIGADQTGGVEFDLGNSPREFTPERVGGRTVVMTTTNGTRALRACDGAGQVFAGAFLNIHAVARVIGGSNVRRLVVVCSGTGETAALEDTLAAGALCEALGGAVELEDSALVALSAWRGAGRDGDWRESVRRSSNARRLLGLAALADDVALCLRTGVLDAVPTRRGGAFVSFCESSVTGAR